MTAPYPLPDKICITGKNIDPVNFKKSVRDAMPANLAEAVLTPDDLLAGPRIAYDVYYAEKARRKDPSRPGVAQECLDCMAHLKANKLPKNYLHEVYGFSHRSTLKPAQAEEGRIIRELAAGPSKDIVENVAVPLKVADVMVAKEIVEFVPKVVEPVDLDFGPEPE